MKRIFFIILFSSIFSFSQEYWLKAEYEVYEFSSFIALENGDIIALGWGWSGIFFRKLILGGGCKSHSYYFKEVSRNVSYEDFDKSKIRMASNYEISKIYKSRDTEYLCYTGCIKVAVCTDDFPPQCTIEKKCNE